ncbi:MAG: winged helix-turn-helix domain-containing protein [candidate division WOR-3 bacterium]|nr:MAG: winged helix-turn-helix domain-containing protein [candidate division WOR-3 bacterium]
MILKTKIQAPQMKSTTVQRDRITTLLKNNIDKKLILINAGAGYGKTTALSQFIARADLPCVFYHLEPSDSELGLFFSYLTTGLKQLNSHFGRRMERILRTLTPATEHVDMVVGTFINEFVEHVPGDALIVLDDYHNIDPSHEIDKALNYLLQHAPENLHLIIATRLQPHFPMTNLKARDDVFVLTNDNLTFNYNEIEQLFKEIHGIVLESDEILALEEHSEGWVTSLQLILQAAGKGLGKKLKPGLPLLQQKDPSKWWSDYFNYFAQEIYQNEPVEVRDFMVSISILEWLDNNACNEITRRKNSGEILRYLEQKNAFVSRMPNGHYRFHNLFREFLTSKWRDTGLRRKTLLRAADHFRDKGQPGLAIPYYLEAGKHNQAARLIRKTGYQMTNSGKSRMVASHIERLPKNSVNTDPQLLMVYSYAQMSNGCPSEAITNLTKAIRLMKKQRKISKELAQAYYDLGSIHFNLGNFETAKRWLLNALRSSSTKRALSNAAMFNSLGLIYSKAGGRKLKDAIACFRKASRIVHRFSENKGLEASIINNWAMAERKSGNLHSARHRIANAVELLKKEANFSPQFGSIFFNAARLNILLGNADKSATILKRALELSQKYNDKCSLAIIWRGYALYYEDLGDLDTSMQHLQKAFSVFQDLHLNRMINLINKDFCRIYTALGRLTAAEQTIAEIWRLKKSRDDAEAVSIHTIEVKLRAAQNKLHDAEDLIARTIRLAKKYALKYELFVALLVQAKLIHINGSESDTLKALRQAVRLSEDNSYDYSLSKFMEEEQWVVGSLMTVADRYTSTVTKRWNISYHLLEVYLFGTPRLVVDGREIEAHAWKTSKALKLFCYLCSHHHKMISRDVLIDALWKNASPSSGARNLRKAIHHIRQALGTVITSQHNPVIYRNKRYQLAPDFSVRLDVEEFEELTRKSSIRHKECERYITKAINLYQDGYAKGWYDDWIETMRNYYDKKYEENLTLMADIALHRRNYRECVTWCRRLVAHNPYDEKYHERLWEVLSKLKKYNEVKKDFNELKRILQKDLKTSPQHQTVAFYESIVK